MGQSHAGNGFSGLLQSQKDDVGALEGIHGDFPFPCS